MLLLLALPSDAPARPTDHAEIERVTIRSFDGVLLDGWLLRPGGTSDRRLPVVLISTPYLDQCLAVYTVPNPPPICPLPRPDTRPEWPERAYPVDFLLDEGYAVALVSVRGTGGSGGCFEAMGRREQRDQAVIVDWLAEQPWSTGHVGMLGLSYQSSTALEAAVQAPEALRTVVVSGIAPDPYTFYFSPEGLATAKNWIGDDARFVSDVSLTPPGTAHGDLHTVARHGGVAAERLCPEVARVMTEGPKAAASGVRDADFWNERRLTDRFGQIRASVLIAHGFGDLWGSGHMMQEDALWPLVTAPKALFEGQWGHTFPVHDDVRDEWYSLLGRWLAHYLKGEGPVPPEVGHAQWEDDAGVWHTSTAWPPPEARAQVLHLSGEERLGPAATAEEGRVTFRSYPQFDRLFATEQFLCPAMLDPVLGAGGQRFITEPVASRTLVAGNPFAYLRLDSDQPGGAVTATLYDLAPGFACDGTTAGEGVRKLTIGGADLRFHHGGFEPRPFSSGRVRIDLANLATVLEPGHRLALVVSYGDPGEFDAAPFFPRVGIHLGESELIVPLAEGDLGGRPPTRSYPPRPLPRP